MTSPQSQKTINRLSPCYRNYVTNKDGLGSPTISPFRPYPITNKSSVIHHEMKNNEVGYKEGDIINYLGVQFPWTELHHDKIEIEKRRNQGDNLADDAMKELMNPSNENRCPMDIDFLSLVKKHANANPGSYCEKFIKEIYRNDLPINGTEVDTPPPPINKNDAASIILGQTTFLKHLPPMSLALIHLSLISGFTSSKINKVLKNSGGYLVNAPPEKTRARLFETTSMIIDCMQDGAASLAPDGRGWLACNKVRLLHAFIRYNLYKKGWDDKRDGGVPINQADMGVTGLSFSLNMMLGYEGICSKPLTEEEVKATVYLWLRICKLMGVKDEYNPHFRVVQAISTLESYLLDIEPDEFSPKAAHSVVRGVAGYGPFFWKPEKHEAVCRLMAGDDVGDILQFSEIGLRSRLALYIVSCAMTAVVRLADLFPVFMMERNLIITKGEIKKVLGDREIVFRGGGGRTDIEKDLKESKNYSWVVLLVGFMSMVAYSYFNCCREPAVNFEA